MKKKRKVLNGEKKGYATPKQNKYKNPQYARKVFSHLSKGMSQLKAWPMIQGRIKS